VFKVPVYLFGAHVSASPSRNIARPVSGPAVRRVLAVARVFLTMAAFLTIYLDPTKPAFAAHYTRRSRYQCRLIVLCCCTAAGVASRARGGQVRVVDMFWASALTFFEVRSARSFCSFSSSCWRQRIAGVRRTIATAL
jgi:hypothetical protein